MRHSKISHPMTEMGHERLGGASCRSSNVRNAPVSDGRLKKAACREGPRANMISSATCCAVTDETGHPVRASAFPLARCREKSLRECQ